MTRPPAALLAGLALAALLPTAPRAETPTDRPTVALGLLRNYCGDCHGPKVARAGMKVTDLAALLKNGHVVPKHPEASEILLRAESGQMPPGGRAKRPSKEELLTLRKWIEEGANGPAPPEVVTGEAFLLDLIARDWAKLPAGEKEKARYVSLNHLLTNDAGAKRLPKARAELERVLASFVAKDKPATKLMAIDKKGSVFRLDLAAWGWDAKPFFTPDGPAPDVGPPKYKAGPLDVFDVLLLEYPYGVAPLDAKGWAAVVPMLRATKAVRPAPYVRGDWLAAALTDKPLGPEVLALLGHDEKAALPEPPAAEAWPQEIDANEAVLEFASEKDRAELAKALPKAASRADWEQRWPALVRQLKRGTPLLTLDRAGTADYSSDPEFTVAGRTLDFTTKQPKTKFKAKDLLALEVTPSKDSSVELAFFDPIGQFEQVKPARSMAGGRAFVEDNVDKETGKGEGYEIDKKEAREAWLILAVGRDGGEANLPSGIALHAGLLYERVRDRYVHPDLYALDGGGTAFRAPFDRAARAFVEFESTGPGKKK